MMGMHTRSSSKNAHMGTYNAYIFVHMPENICAQPLK